MPRLTSGRRMGTCNKYRGSFPASVSPTSRDLEWAAGFLEGEGCFKANNNRCEIIEASQVNPEPLGKLLVLFGGRVRHKPQPTATSNDFWVWVVSGPRARGIMLTLYPLLSVKRQQQVEIALLSNVPVRIDS